MSKEPQIIASLDIETGQGAFLAHYSKDGLAALDFPSGRARPASTQGEGKAPTLQVERWHKIAVAALLDTLNGKSPRQLPPLDWAGGTDFQKSVWAALCKIPAGKTQTYAGVAALLGKPRAARAVGAACGANPIPVLVPCHRVVAAGGGLGGFSGGLEWKRRLLEIEQTRN